MFRMIKSQENLFLLPARFWPVWGNGPSIFISSAIVAATFGLIVWPILGGESATRFAFACGMVFVVVSLFMCINDVSDDDHVALFTKEIAGLAAMVNPPMVALYFIISIVWFIGYGRREEVAAW